ncbi:MAG: phosphate transporter substrate-binding protein PhoT family [Ramlibacter sp.]|nr:phosphate transporter substrate-binding protein PhoT family [Ramlibacter sp.]
MTFKFISFVALCAVFGSGVADAQVLEVSGATTVQRRVLEPGAEPLKTATGIQLKVMGPGTGKGMLALFDGKVSVAAAGENLEDAVASAKAAAAETGRAVNVPANLVYHQIASDNIVVAVHANNPVKSLGRQQIKDMMTGKIKNWKQVGGPDLPVKLYAAAAGQAVRTAVQKGFMDGAEYPPETTDIRTAIEQLRVIAGEPGAIGAMSEPIIKAGPEKVHVVAGATIPRPLGFVTVGAPSPAAQKMIDYFRSTEGQKQIR